MFFVDYWAKTAVAQERPDVMYKNKLYTELLFVDDVTNNLQTFEYSTVAGVNAQA